MFKECIKPVHTPKNQLPADSFCRESGLRITKDQHGRYVCPPGCAVLKAVANRGREVKNKENESPRP